MKKLITILIAFLIGILPGFFIVFNAVFTDSNGKISERLLTFVLVIIIYSAIGFVFGLIDKRTPWKWAVSLSLPAILILILYTFNEPGLVWLNIVYICFTLASTWVGTYIGIKLRTRKKF